jgi:hypothetical protein
MDYKKSTITQEHKSKIDLCTYALITCALLLAGCVQQKKYEPAKQICVQQIDKAKVMQIAEDVLGDMHFVIDKSDSKNGLIKTKPLRGGQFFELWRSDNIGSYNAIEANLHSIRRIVQLQLNQKKACPRRMASSGELSRGNCIYIECHAKTEKLSISEYEVTSNAQAYRLFSENISTMQRARFSPEQRAKMAWIDLGEDKLLEAEILKRIEKQISKVQKEETQ